MLQDIHVDIAFQLRWFKSPMNIEANRFAHTPESFSMPCITAIQLDLSENPRLRIPKGILDDIDISLGQHVLLGPFSRSSLLDLLRIVWRGSRVVGRSSRRSFRLSGFGS